MIDLNNKKVLIVRLGKIGDLIISSFVFEVLKKGFYEIEISLLTLESNREVLKYNTDIDHSILSKKNLSLYFQLLSLRKISFDLVIDLNDDPSTTSSAIRKIIKAKRIVGFNFTPDKSPDLFPQPPKDKTHIIERISFLMNELVINLNKNEIHPKLYLGSEENSDIEKQLDPYKNQNKIIALNLSAGAEIRYWNIEYWIELINRIHTKLPEILFLPLSTDKDGHLRNKIFEKISKDFLIDQKFKSFHHFASYIYNSDFLISPDTSAVHIASAFNKPMVAIYPDYEWNYVSWNPLSNNFKAIKSKSNFINSVSVDEVFNSFMDIYNKHFN
ncbi:MAG: glycosyltransferase family 9 protein [Ignavibacteriota bacterium]